MAEKNAENKRRRKCLAPKKGTSLAEN